MKSKAISILLVFVLLFSVAGCTKDESTDGKASQNVANEKNNGELKPEEGAKLVVWESEGKEGDFIKYAAEKFKEKYGVEVVYEEVKSTKAEEQLAQAGPAGEGPDIFATQHDHLGALVNAGLVLELNELKDRIDNDFVPLAKKACEIEGNIYGMPVSVETYALFYNKDIFPEAPKTYQEIIEKAKTYNDSKNNKYAFMWDVGNAYFTHGFVIGNGGYIFGKGGTDKDDIGLAKPEAIEGAKQMLKLKEILPVKQLDSTCQIMEGLFDEGKVGAMIDGPWAIANRKKTDVNFGVAALPTMINGKHQGSFSGVREMFVSYYTKYPNASKLFIKFITTDEMLLKRYEMTHQIPPSKALMEKDELKNDEFVAPFIEQIKYAEPMPLITQMKIVWAPYGAAFSTMWDNGDDPEQALKDCVQIIKDSIAAEE
ncbi:maltose ABC transporter substrate-binding protein [Clostridiaceae bacterium M8S5]|nr:maltose ABC transporter substrate-binding protein [Clostridiaceae bacterium M8S5]